MTNIDAISTSIERVCATWETAIALVELPNPIPCSSAIVLEETSTEPRFCYVSAASPLEQLFGETTDLFDRSGSLISMVALTDRLMSNEVAGVLAPRGPVTYGVDDAAPTPLPAALIARRQAVRRDNVHARFLLRQIGLEEVSSHRGAGAQLYSALAALWSTDLALSIDPAMMLTLGADRQRHVDVDYEERARLRLPRALGRLNDAGVRSYPRLVII